MHRCSRHSTCSSAARCCTTSAAGTNWSIGWVWAATQVDRCLQRLCARLPMPAFADLAVMHAACCVQMLFHPTRNSHDPYADPHAVLSKILKRLVRIERPAATCKELGLCGDLGACSRVAAWPLLHTDCHLGSKSPTQAVLLVPAGMPSTHSQVMAFAWVTMVLQVLLHT